MNTIKVYLEQNDLYWGHTDTINNWFANGGGKSIEAMLTDLRSSIEDHIEHEGKDDEYWSKVNLDISTYEVVDYLSKEP